MTTLLLTSFLEVGTAIESRRVVCLIQARLYQMIVRSVFYCVLPMMRCAFGAHLDVGLAERRTPRRLV